MYILLPFCATVLQFWIFVTSRVLYWFYNEIKLWNWISPNAAEILQSLKNTIDETNRFQIHVENNNWKSKNSALRSPTTNKMYTFQILSTDYVCKNWRFCDTLIFRLKWFWKIILRFLNLIESNKYHLRTVTIVTDDMLEKSWNCIRSPKKIYTDEKLMEKKMKSSLEKKIVLLLFK